MPILINGYYFPINRTWNNKITVFLKNSSYSILTDVIETSFFVTPESSTLNFRCNLRKCAYFDMNFTREYKIDVKSYLLIYTSS